MHKEFLMGNEAIARGAIAAGVNLVCGYPGTPSTEVLETAAKCNTGNFYVEWSVNEKCAMEIAAGAAYCGARALVTMKQMGLNVASDPLMCVEYIGVKGGMVVLVADDPGPISSQTEQDTRHFSAFSKVPCFDPSTPQEAYEMIQEAFDFSEKYETPVFLRSTTRVSHGYSSIDVKDESEYKITKPEGFIKDTQRWVIFPRLAFLNHQKIVARNRELSDVFSDYEKNRIYPEDLALTDFLSATNNCITRITQENTVGNGQNIGADKSLRQPKNGIATGRINFTYEMKDCTKKGVATGGVSFTYAMEARKELGDFRLFKVSTPFPFPEKKALEFLSGLDEVLCVEELDPVIERELIFICGKYNLNVRIRGKLTGDVRCAGENTRDSVRDDIATFMNITPQNTSAAKDVPQQSSDAGPDMPPHESAENRNAQQPAEEQNTPQENLTADQNPPPLPVRPPVLCAGCPHRASFYAVKRAMKGEKTIFCGDIGCYTLGNAMPLDMVDTCLCMGAGLGIAQGVEHIEPDTNCFAFVGDSTFFASALPGMVNAVYNRSNMTLVILDNSTTAMTGHQPHPGTGKSVMGEAAPIVDMESVLKGIGVQTVETVDPLNHKEAVACVRRIAAAEGVKAIIFRSPCIALVKPGKPLHVDSDRCIGCKRCINEIGCPALVLNEDKVSIDAAQCTGCTLCSQLCAKGAIPGGAL